ncbi:MAG: hypothetical protein JW772_05205 [Candidatus Diapherotrites archaeon]|nr:hypothetical protein [Candidatus Diapherotrites archaeon]
MKYSVYPETRIEHIPKDTEAIHLVRPVKKDFLEKIIKKCKGLKRICMSNSCFHRLSPRARKSLKNQKIELRIETRRGRAIEIPFEKMLEIIEMQKDFQSVRAIEEKTKVPKSTVHYLVKYAQRTKIKKGSETIHLK